MKIEVSSFHHLFSLTAELNAGTVSPDNIDFSAYSWVDVSEIDWSDNQKRVFKILGVNRDGYNTVGQLLFGYLNVFTNKDNLLTEAQLSALKSSVFSGGVNETKVLAKKLEIQGIEDIYPDIQGFDDIYPYLRKFGREMILFVVIFKAHAEDYAIFAALDAHQQGIPDALCSRLNPSCTIAPMVKRIIENIVQ